MKPLVWKELRENLKWTVVPILLIVGPMAMFGAFPLMDRGLLFYAALIAAVFGANLNDGSSVLGSSFGSDGNLATTLGSAQVMIGGQPAPLFY